MGPWHGSEEDRTKVCARTCVCGSVACGGMFRILLPVLGFLQPKTCVPFPAPVCHKGGEVSERPPRA